MTRMEYLNAKAKTKAKVREKVEKAKERAMRAKAAVSDFVSKHPGVVIGTVVLGTGVGMFLRGLNSNDQSYYIPPDPQSDNNYAGMVQKGLSEDGNEETINYIPAKNENDESEKEAFKKLWEENYKENWDKVVSFADTLDLKPGEMFMIEDSKQYADEPWYDGKPVISHLVDNYGIYPPED